MKNLILLVLIGAVSAFGQWADFSSQTASTNLSGAMNGKSSFQINAGAPTSLNGTAGKDFAFNSTASTMYFCATTGTPCASWLQFGVHVTPVPITLFTAECQGASPGQSGSYNTPNNPTAICDASGSGWFGASQFTNQPAADQCRTQLILLPSDFVNTTTPTLDVNWQGVGTTGSFTWSVATAPSATGTVPGTVSFNTADTVSHAPQGTTLQWRMDTITMTNGVTGMAANSIVTIKLCRSHSDSATSNANLLNARFTYYVNR